MKYKTTLEPKLEEAKIILESAIKGMDNNTISKDELRVKLDIIYKHVDTIANFIAIESND